MLIRNQNSKLVKNNRRKSIDYRAAIITERFLSMMLKVVSNPDFSIAKKLQNFQAFITATPFDEYEKDINVYALLLSINCVLKHKLEGANEVEDLINYVNIELSNYEDLFSDVKENIIFPAILASSEVSDKEISLVTKTCYTYIRHEAILTHKDELIEIVTDLESGNIGSIDESLEELQNVITLLYDEFYKTNNSDGELNIYHTSRPEEFREKFKNAYDYENSPKMALHTGLKDFDKMLSIKGGFLGGTFVLFYADTNSFKSALLENIKRWIKVYNSDMFMEEFLKTGKRPTIIFISIENGSNEDLSRDFSIQTKTNMNSVDTFDEAFTIWKESNNDSIIDVTQINAGDVPISFTKVKRIVKQVEQDGFFPIAIIVDSFDLMAPDEDDVARGVTDETTLLLNRARAIEKWISDKPYPIISAHQLNRQAAMTLAEKRAAGCVDLCKFLGREHVSGSYDINRRAHITMFVNTEYSKYDGEKYLEINRDKVRYRDPGEENRYIVTKLINGFFIEDDQGKPFKSTRHSILPVEDTGDNAGDVPQAIMGRGVAKLDTPKSAITTVKSKAITTPKPMFSTDVGAGNTMIIPIIPPTYFCYSLTPVSNGINPFNSKQYNIEGDYCLDPAAAKTPYDI